jgi:hypothetical protein
MSGLQKISLCLSTHESKSRTSISQGTLGPYFTTGSSPRWTMARSVHVEIERYAAACFSLRSLRAVDWAPLIDHRHGAALIKDLRF